MFHWPDRKQPLLGPRRHIDMAPYRDEPQLLDQISSIYTGILNPYIQLLSTSTLISCVKCADKLLKSA